MWHSNKSWTTAKKTTFGGKQYDSKFEAGYAQELTLRMKAGEIDGFDTHVAMPLIVNGYHIGDYKIDFVVYHKDGTVEYTETKGFSTRDWALRWKIFCAMHEDNPDEKVTLVWQGKAKNMRRIKKVG